MRTLSLLLLASFAFAIAGCSGGVPTPSPSVVPAVGDQPSIESSWHRGCIKRPHCRRKLTSPILSIFVASGDRYNKITPGYVLAFPATAGGDATPTRDIGGFNTGLGRTTAVAFDSAGNLYVKHQTFGCTGECISVFAPGADGNVKPIRQICGSNTGIYPTPVGGGIAVGPDGTLYVAQNSDIAPQDDKILEFAPGANGNVAPSAVLTGVNTDILEPNGLFVDSSGKLYVANELKPGPFTFFEGSITVYAPGASGYTAPIEMISGDAATLDDPEGIAVDSNGNIHVVDGNTYWGILTFPMGANGNVAPSSVIKGPATRLFDARGIAIDDQGATFVSTFISEPSGTHSPPALMVFAPGASGDAQPESVTGSNTKLFDVGFIALHTAAGASSTRARH